jgi:hypothetical protein
VDFLSKNIRKIQAGGQHHNRTCGVPARAILMHPTEHAKLGVEKLLGTPDLCRRAGPFGTVPHRL